MLKVSINKIKEVKATKDLYICLVIINKDKDNKIVQLLLYDTLKDAQIFGKTDVFTISANEYFELPNPIIIAMLDDSEKKIIELLKANSNVTKVEVV